MPCQGPNRVGKDGDSRVTSTESGIDQAGQDGSGQRSQGQDREGVASARYGYERVRHSQRTTEQENTSALGW